MKQVAGSSPKHPHQVLSLSQRTVQTQEGQKHLQQVLQSTQPLVTSVKNPARFQIPTRHSAKSTILSHRQLAKKFRKQNESLELQYVKRNNGHLYQRTLRQQHLLKKHEMLKDKYHNELNTKPIIRNHTLFEDDLFNEHNEEEEIGKEAEILILEDKDPWKADDKMLNAGKREEQLLKVKQNGESNGEIVEGKAK